MDYCRNAQLKCMRCEYDWIMEMPAGGTLCRRCGYWYVKWENHPLIIGDPEWDKVGVWNEETIQ